MTAFIDRKEEMQTLSREYERDGSSFVVMYGRRRVGKTTLIEASSECVSRWLPLATHLSLILLDYFSSGI